MIDLRDKEHERGQLREHDSKNSKQHLAKIDLRKIKSFSGNIMDDILKFNQMLFQQISQNPDLKMKFNWGEDCLKKNYLLVPLTLC